MKQSNLWRIRTISILVLIFAFLLIGRLYLLQVVNGKEYSERADAQYVSPTQQIFDRGTIYFQNRDGSLYSAATVQSGLLLSIDPKLLVQGGNGSTTITNVYQRINALLPINESAFLAKAESTSTSYQEIADKISSDKGTPLEKLNIPGLSLSDENWRVYPGGDLAANVLGLVGSEGNDLGYGLEHYYNNVLERDTQDNYVNFFAQIFSNIGNTISSQGTNLQGDIVASIEPNVQQYLQQQLIGIQTQWQSDFSGGIIMDPHTGQIYGIAMSPSFDPNTPQDQSSSDIFSDPLVQNVYEMGSIVKALTMAAALDSGTVTPATTYNDTACITVNTQKICNYDDVGRGVIPVETILNDSLNVGASYLATKMGTTTQAKYFREFGLGLKTGIDLPSEASGLIGNLNSPRQIEFDTASFGQGIAMTPIETVRALGTLANDGILPPCPHLVDQINYDLGYSKAVTCPDGPRIISETTDQEVTKMLVDTVDKSLFNGTFSLPHYSVAAKTGTAEISEGNGQGYFPGTHYLDSYFAFFPAINPRFIVFIFTHYPKGGPYSDNVLTTPLFNIIKYLINYYQIAPDR
jgi:cell division protein FtsI (penicillin-binding protein 3)/stage V sporulation protein D (sporulation-specific penicillin-binding protein)